jgi:hypothetical protein
MEIYIIADKWNEPGRARAWSHKLWNWEPSICFFVLGIISISIEDRSITDG